MMANINQNRRFDEGANTFELPIRDLKEMQEKEVAPAKMKEDRVKFTRYDVSLSFKQIRFVFIIIQILYRFIDKI